MVAIENSKSINSVQTELSLLHIFKLFYRDELLSYGALLELIRRVLLKTFTLEYNLWEKGIFLFLVARNHFY